MHACEPTCLHFSTRMLRLVLLVNLALALACPPGTFQPTEEPNCIPCPSGHVSNGNEPCAACEAGTFAHVDKCIPCPIGTQAPTPATLHCSACGIGLVAPNAGTVECEACPPNTRAVSSSVCVACPPNHFSNSSTGVCFPCPPGTEFRQNGCQPCLPGTEAPFAGMQCQECESGTFASTPGTVKCGDCERGFITKPGQTIVCHPCPTGLDTRWPGDDYCYDTVLSSDRIPDDNTVMVICFVLLAFLLTVFVIVFLISRKT
jgi:hypothetical protein